MSDLLERGTSTAARRRRRPVEVIVMVLVCAAIGLGIQTLAPKANAVEVDTGSVFTYITFSRAEVRAVDAKSGYAATLSAACGFIPNRVYGVACAAASSVFIVALSNTFHAANQCDGKVVLKLAKVAGINAWVFWDIYKSACNVPGGGGGGGSW